MKTDLVGNTVSVKDIKDSIQKGTVCNKMHLTLEKWKG